MVVLLLREIESDGTNTEKRGRRRLLRLGLNPDSENIDAGALPGFRAVLAPASDPAAG